MSVLIVEDDDDSRESLADVLEAAGHRAVSAATAEQALHLLENEGGLTLVLLDLVGVDGWRIAERIGPSKPVVVVSGYVDAAPPPRNAVATLQKPFSVPILLGLVDRFDGAPTREPPPPPG